jgi:hypothetical protein
LKKCKKLISIMEKKKTTSLHIHTQTSCSCELDSKRNSFSILHKSQSTKYKKNVTTIMLQGADVFQHVHLKLSTLEWHHQVHLYTPCFSHSEKQMSADSDSHTRHLLHIPNCQQKSSTSGQFLKNTPIYQIAFTLTAAWWYTSAIKKPEPQIRIHHVCIQRSQ